MIANLPRRVLIVRLGAIGDVVNALVVATALHDASPTMEIDWAVHDLALPLVEGHPALRRVHVWSKGSGLGGLRSLLADLRTRSYDLAIDLQRIAKSAAVARASGAGRVLGFDRGRSKEASWLLAHERIDRGDPRSHMVDQYMEFVRHLGLRAGEPRFEIPNDPSAVGAAEALVTTLGAAPILINVGATKPANRWPPERFAELASACARRFDAPVCVTGGPSDREIASIAASGDPRIIDLSGRTTLLGLAELQRRSRLVVSCDSGPMHLASAVGATVVALFGAADERRTGPYGARHIVVRTNPACAPCNAKNCLQPRHDCMLDLTVERVVSAVDTALRR